MNPEIIMWVLLGIAVLSFILFGIVRPSAGMVTVSKLETQFPVRTKTARQLSRIGILSLIAMAILIAVIVVFKLKEYGVT